MSSKKISHSSQEMAQLKKQQEIIAQLREGKIPPGVVLRQPGQAPPGAVDLGSMRKMMQNSDHKSMLRLQHNPIDKGDTGLAVMRGLSGCTIPENAQQLNALMGQIISDESLDDVAILQDALATGINVALTTNRYCRKNLQKRIIVDVEKEESLKELTQKIKSIEEELTVLKEAYEELLKELQTLHQTRWETTVKTCGLSPEKNVYQLDSDTGNVYEMSLSCDQCLGITKITEAVALIQDELEKHKGAPDDQSN